ncbi:DNA-binding response regulator [Meridianimarinicoccus sp. RP-17]|uniref:DNA-binding response regulator n=1 Tax=Meridianimarinicoccus zhengii TaxID=2056810 RepID=UPI000DACB31C|nr:DNA-binding response regulator [Phycocomes zhengii]
MPGTFRPTQPVARHTVAILCGPPPLARLCETTLERMGLAPRRLSDGADAMRTLETAPPDLLLVLLMGRDPAALALCQAVGQEPAFAGTRLVVVQDSARDIDRRRARALGADAVLPLPLDPGMLDRAIRPLLAVPA